MMMLIIALVVVILLIVIVIGMIITSGHYKHRWPDVPLRYARLVSQVISW